MAPGAVGTGRGAVHETGPPPLLLGKGVLPLLPSHARAEPPERPRPGQRTGQAASAWCLPSESAGGVHFNQMSPGQTDVKGREQQGTGAILALPLGAWVAWGMSHLPSQSGSKFS